jgi:galactonate dehydratase
MYRGTFYRGGPILSSAISGVEQALWDLLGKHLGVPVWQLLGGHVRDRIRLYGRVRIREAEGSAGGGGAPTCEVPAGFGAYKFSPLPASRMIETPAAMDLVVAKVAAAREAVGRDADLAIDFHGRCTPALSKRLARKLEPFDLLFIEEPVLPGDTEALGEVARSTVTPIAAGERLYTRWQFQDLIGQQAVAVVQPDLSHCGGIHEARKIAAMAEARNIAIAPHCPLGPVSLAACLQLAACTPNFLCQEHASLGDGYLARPFELVDGHVPLPQGPGLGIELDDEAIAGKQFEGDWDTPRWYLDDGSFAEW